MTYKPFTTSLGIILALMALTSCKTDSRNTETPEVSYDGLIKIETTATKSVWADPDFNPRLYSNLLLRQVGIQYAPTQRKLLGRMNRRGGFHLSDVQKQKLNNIVEEAFRDSLQSIRGFTIVEKPTDRTLLLLISVTEVESHVPVETFNQHEIYLSDVGEATLILEFIDSNTGATMARAIDHKVAETIGPQLQRSSSIRNWQAVRKLAEAWAANLQTGIDQMKKAKQKE